MIVEPRDPTRTPPIAESTHEQTDDKLTEKEAKQMKDDDQAIQKILMGLPKEIYAAVDSCDTAQEINGNVVATRAEDNANGNNGNQIRCYNCRGVGECEEIEEVNANCILMANLQQASSLGIQADKAPIYDSDRSAEVYNNEIFNIMEHSGGIVEQHPATVEETRAFFESLYNNLVIEVKKVNTVNRKMKEANAELTTKLAIYKGQEKYFEFN
ncbi:hypothetical protein Tco_0266715 [Tanacetum coccineum]